MTLYPVYMILLFLSRLSCPSEPMIQSVVYYLFHIEMLFMFLNKLHVTAVANFILGTC